MLVQYFYVARTSSLLALREKSLPLVPAFALLSKRVKESQEPWLGTPACNTQFQSGYVIVVPVEARMSLRLAIDEMRS